MEEPLLSVCLITYNHAKYFKQAIESILMQKTSFNYEIIIADDCSTDGTTEMVRYYAAAYPGKIRPLIHEKNVGPAQNYLQLLKAAKGKYIAYLEADDYWIGNTKLQQQVSFLESHPDYALCFHSVYNLVNGKQKSTPAYNTPDTSDINYLLSHTGYINTLSIVYRNSSHITGLLEKLIDSPYGDFMTYVAAAQTGLIKFIPQKMAVYRVHTAGIWSSLGVKKAFEKTIAGYRMLYAHLPEAQQVMLKIRYLVKLEEYFMQDFFAYTEEEFIAMQIKEMNIEPYMIEYLKLDCEQRRQKYHYISRVPLPLLLASVKQKLINRFL